MTNNHSLRDFLSKYNQVEIPLLQRDYAQGRLDAKSQDLNSKGANFIKVLFDALHSGEGLRMDIIYGSIKDNTFIPLDGQQRLSTLWLLHWYLAQWEGKGQDYAEWLKKFTYATRDTARDFCKRLCKLQLTRDELAKPSDYFGERIWFTSEYHYDPTVQAMLNMLDAIACEVRERGAVDLEQLERLQFRSFDIGKYQLTDDLYIKMNKRGKQLEGIENLKADFVGYLKEQGHDFSSDDSYDRKLDHAWADMAWGKKANDGFDLRYLRLFNHYFYNLWIINNNYPNVDKIPDQLKWYFTGGEYRGFEAYKELLEEEGRLERMVSFFDFLTTDEGPIFSKALLSPWDESQDPSYPYLIDKEEPAMRERVALYALMLYFDNSSTDNPDRLKRYEEWMRIVWNLIADPRLRSYSVQKHYMHLLKALAPKAEHIEEYLLEMNVSEIEIEYKPTSKEAKRLKLEQEKKRLKLEQEKLRYLQSYPQRREALHKAERIPCLQGQVDFLLKIEHDDAYFSGIVEQAVQHIKGDWDTSWVLWKGIIALLEEQLFDLDNEGKSDYLAHKGYGSGIEWRLQELLNRTHIAEALRKLLELCLEEDKDFGTICDELVQAYQLDERFHWHYPLVKTDILKEAKLGRLYHRHEEGICLQRYWTVTESENCGYYRLDEQKPILRTKPKA